MFWADSNMIYWHDGASVRRIGEPILRNQLDSNMGWLGQLRTTPPAVDNDPVLVYDARYDMVVALVTASGPTPIGWAFHVGSQKWVLLRFTYTTDLYSATTAQAFTAFVGAFMRADGRVLYITNAATKEMHELFGCANSTTAGTRSLVRPWRWVSSIIAEFAKIARLYHLYVAFKSTRPGTIIAHVNNTRYAASLESDNKFTVSDWTTSLGSGSIDKGELTNTTGVWLSARNFAIDITAAAGDTAGTYYDVNQMEVVFLPLSPR
jgi:hypothetical protein